jgi:hypothetical protein
MEASTCVRAHTHMCMSIEPIGSDSRFRTMQGDTVHRNNETFVRTEVQERQFLSKLPEQRLVLLHLLPSRARKVYFIQNTENGLCKVLSFVCDRNVLE